MDGVSGERGGWLPSGEPGNSRGPRPRSWRPPAEGWLRGNRSCCSVCPLLLLLLLLLLSFTLPALSPPERSEVRHSSGQALLLYSQNTSGGLDPLRNPLNSVVQFPQTLLTLYHSVHTPKGLKVLLLLNESCMKLKTNHFYLSVFGSQRSFNLSINKPLKNLISRVHQ